jgi:hypothetical protein
MSKASGSITTMPVSEEDPTVGAFLSFMEKDLRARPGQRSGLSKASLAGAIRLTKRVKVADDHIIPRSVSL